MDLNSRWRSAAFYRTAVCGLAKTAASKKSLARKPGGVFRGQKDSEGGDITWLADGAYAGALQMWVRGLRKWGKARLDIVRKAKGQRGFAVVPWRWIVERTFAWLGRYRRLKSDYERLPETTEAIIHIAMIRLMVRRLVV